MNQQELIADLLELQKTMPPDEFEALIKRLAEAGTLEIGNTDKIDKAETNGCFELTSWKSIAIIAWIITTIATFFLLPSYSPSSSGDALDGLIKSANSSIGLRCLLSPLIIPVGVVLLILYLFWDDIAICLVTCFGFLGLKLIWNFLGWFRRILIPVAILGLVGGAISIFLGRVSLPLNLESSP